MAFSTTDTIVAIATPPGRGGIGVVRISGAAATTIAARLMTRRLPLEPRLATFTRLVEANDGGAADPVLIDQAVATFFPAPHSYTGEDVVELSAHGSPVVLRTIVAAAAAAGARLAEAGEFTLRAFLNGRIDLPQAEAVADLIDAVTPLQARAAFDQLEGTLTGSIGEIDALLFELIAKLEASVDFPDEGYHFIEPGHAARSIEALLARTGTLLGETRRGRLIREGLQVAIVGNPNVGKSSIFNALVGAPRAIVTDVPGTTRDLVTEAIDLDGLRVTLVDTAGLRDASGDPIEAEGISRSLRARGVADLVLHVVDTDARAVDGFVDGDVVDRQTHNSAKHFTVQNKRDLGGPQRPDTRLFVSAKTGEGIGELRRAIVDALDVDLQRDRPAITNLRHAALVQRAHESLQRALAAASAEDGALPEEFLLADLQDARAALEEVSGRRAPDDLLHHIFERFCIGK
jgi:tRNA modification GTPase